MARINAVSFHEEPSIERICRVAREAGFDSIELSRPPFFEKLLTRGTRWTFGEWANRLGLELYGFDCWVEVDPYQAREETLDGFRKALEFAADLELGMVITHDPWAKVNGGRSPTECLRINTELFREVADLAAQKELRLVFEPHPDTLSMSNAWAIDFIDGIGRANVGILFDFCHYGVGQPEDYVQSVTELGKRIHHLHLSDGDLQTYALHLPLGDGELDLKALMAALKSIGYRGTMTNDLYRYPLLEDGARRNADRVREVELDLGISTRWAP